MENIQEIYNGSVRLKFVDSIHGYFVSVREGGEWSSWVRKTGVTTFIGIKDKSGPLKYWVANIMHAFLHDILRERGITTYDLDDAKILHTKRLEQAASSGSKVHDWIKAYVDGDKPDIPQEDNVLRGINAFLDWEKKNKIKIVASEVPLYSRAHDYCGTADAIIKIGTKKFLLDFKTSSGLYNDVLMQTAAYVHAYEEMGLGTIAGRFAIRLEKRSEEEFKLVMDNKGAVNARYEPFEALSLDSDQKADFEAFLAAKRLFEWDKSSAKLLQAKHG